MESWGEMIRASGSAQDVLFAVSVLDGVVSTRFLVPGAESASVSPCLSNIAIRAHSPAQVRGPCRMPVSFPEGMV